MPTRHVLSLDLSDNFSKSPFLLFFGQLCYQLVTMSQSFQKKWICIKTRRLLKTIHGQSFRNFVQTRMTRRAERVQCSKVHRDSLITLWLRHILGRSLDQQAGQLRVAKELQKETSKKPPNETKRVETVRRWKTKCTEILSALLSHSLWLANLFWPSLSKSCRLHIEKFCSSL